MHGRHEAVTIVGGGGGSYKPPRYNARCGREIFETFAEAMNRAKWIGFLCLGITALGWGLNWPGVKILLREWPPLFSSALGG